tara:strand:- start:330 stop:578 length:249 start_codon:yes stop_codon:yes gene_type:complete
MVKFSLSVGIPLLAFAIGYGSLQNRVLGMEAESREHKIEIATIKKQNHQRDLETVSFRSNITNRVENIEKLTEEIHTAVVNH